jgi:hypothetical protein
MDNGEKKMIRSLIAQFTTASAAMLVYLAHLYDTAGYGLNPWIALPLATLLMVYPHIFNAWWIDHD